MSKIILSVLLLCLMTACNNKTSYNNQPVETSPENPPAAISIQEQKQLYQATVSVEENRMDENIQLNYVLHKSKEDGLGWKIYDID